jgi:hypothetical protein
MCSDYRCLFSAGGWRVEVGGKARRRKIFQAAANEVHSEPSKR